MSTLAKTGADAGITSDPQVINPANNLPEVDIIDASQTKSDAKGAGTAAQADNAAAAEMNKAKTIQALRKHFDDFTPAGVAFDESATRKALKAAGLNDSVIKVTIKQAKKDAANTITVDEFINHINSDAALKNDILNYCGNACLDHDNLITGDSVNIYHSSDDENTGFVEQTLSDEISYFVESASVTVSNLIKSVASYSMKRNAIGKMINFKGDAKLSLVSLGTMARAIALTGLYTETEIIQAVTAQISGLCTFNSVERL